MDSTMLVVDDSELNRNILVLMFDQEYDVIEAESADEALEVLEACAGNIDIILLDLMMPGMNGMDFLKMHRNDPNVRDVPIVIVTSTDTPETQVQVFEYGASDFIAKPFVPEIVVSRVHNVMAATKRITEMQLEQEALKVKTELDQMTGLFNKVTGEELMRQALQMDPEGIQAMLMIDIDNFKSVNDNEGHLVGDQTIKIIANQIVKSFRKSDIVTRFGGDEFSVMMTGLPSRLIAVMKAKELASLMKYKPNLTLPANVSVSIGLAFNDGNQMTYEKLFEHADEALYEAKSAGKARVAEYGVKLDQKEKEQREMLLLISRSRNVCSNVQAVSGLQYLVKECGNNDSLSVITKEEQENHVLSFIDISEEMDDGELYLAGLLADFPWIAKVPFIVLYAEGHMDQVKTALRHDTMDIVSAPIEMKTIRHLTDKYLGKKEDELDRIIKS